jgi:hypothetical protein
MVLIWTDLASGDREMATVLVALNAVFQVLLYAALGFFYLQVLPGWLGLQTASLHVSIAEIAGTVAVFLGIPLAAGYLTRTIGERARGRDWYEHRFLPRIGPVALYGLLFTVVILFALQGKKITSAPLDVARIALPLLAYFAIMWSAGFAVSRRLHLSYPRTVALTRTMVLNRVVAVEPPRAHHPLRHLPGSPRCRAGHRLRGGRLMSKNTAGATVSVWVRRRQRFRHASILTSVDATWHVRAMRFIDACRYLLEIARVACPPGSQTQWRGRGTLTRPTDRRMPCP